MVNVIPPPHPDIDMIDSHQFNEKQSQIVGGVESESTAFKFPKAVGL